MRVMRYVNNFRKAECNEDNGALDTWLVFLRHPSLNVCVHVWGRSFSTGTICIDLPGLSIDYTHKRSNTQQH